MAERGLANDGILKMIFRQTLFSWREAARLASPISIPALPPSYLIFYLKRAKMVAAQGVFETTRIRSS
jgi:hypothetical protein